MNRRKHDRKNEPTDEELGREANIRHGESSAPNTRIISRSTSRIPEFDGEDEDVVIRHSHQIRTVCDSYMFFVMYSPKQSWINFNFPTMKHLPHPLIHRRSATPALVSSSTYPSCGPRPPTCVDNRASHCRCLLHLHAAASSACHATVVPPFSPPSSS